MATQEREIVDLLWDGGQDANALDKLKDMLQVKAAAAVDASKLDIANKMFPVSYTHLTLPTNREV